MRHARVRAKGTGCYHVVSRTVDRVFRLDDGEKAVFQKIMRATEAFCGVRVLTYAVMSDHFHLLVEVPGQTEVGEAELVRRMTVLYGRATVAGVLEQWAEWLKNGEARLVREQQDKLRQRMDDVSAFVKTLKQRYSMSFNSRHGRRGTLWENRFKSVLVENAESVKATVAAYIDLNPVRAKIVDDPKNYRWSGYGEACRGGKRARESLSALYDASGRERAGDWRHAVRRYRTLLSIPDGAWSENGVGSAVRAACESSEVERVIEEGRKLTLQQALRCRVRYFTDGMVIGGTDFVERVFGENRHYFGPKRKDGARKMRFAEWGELRTARALRIAPVSAPIDTRSKLPG